MNYILCNKDIPVLRFSTEDEEISEVSEIINREHLPIGISPENEYMYTEINIKTKYNV